MKQSKQKDWKTFLYLIRDTKPPVAIIIIAFSMSLISTVVGLFIPLFTKNLVDGFSLTSLSGLQIAGLVIAFIGQAIASGVSIYLLNQLGQRIVASMRAKLWDKLLVLKVPYYDVHQTGETISRMSNDTAVVKGLITEHLPQFITGIISIVGSIIILLTMDWKMTLLMLVAVPLTFLVLLPLGRQMFKISKGLQDETAKFTAHISKVLSEIRLVKASNAEPLESVNGNKGIQELFKFGMKEAKIQAVIIPIMFLVIMSVMVLIIGYGGIRVSSGALSSGDLVAFILYLFQIIMPLTSFTTFFTQLQKAKGATERIIYTLEQPEELSQGEEPNVKDCPIVADGVSFAYENNTPVLNKVSFSSMPGKVTAFVGPSGAGKTTLFSLMERFYEPVDGTIKLGQTAISEFNLSSWRKQIGYVSQESPLIAGTIRENLCYGVDREVTDAELDKATIMAYADEFIDKLPRKYDTEVGERGFKLSGGQRQRIGIARALLRDPKILMLDEATSNLDSQSEIVVQNALKNLMEGRTTFVIAHRLSTVVEADQILFMEKGTITGSGTHDELFENHAMYREFASQQFRYNESAHKQ